MVRRKLPAWACATIVLGCQASLVYGQNYPVKPVRIVTTGAGGSNDLTARLIAQGISGSLGQQVVVDNRTGALPGRIVSQAPGDGYTLMLAASTFTYAPFLGETHYDPVKDFSPITLATRAPSILVVGPAWVQSVNELISLARARPGALNYASGLAGAANHLAAELFKSMAGVNIVRVSYKSTAAALNDLIGGQVQMTFLPAPAVVQHVKSGRLKALAITSAEPSELFPALSTVASAGVPGYEAVSSTGVYAPVKTSVSIILRLNQEIVRFLKTAAAKERFLNAGADVVGSTPEQLANSIKADMARMGKVITAAGIKEE